MATLKNVLIINALSSGATAILLIVFSGLAADLFEVSQTGPFIGTGVFLLLFAGLVLISALRKPIQKNNVKTIILLDCLWVLASLMVIVLQPFAVSGLGIAIIAAVAVWVALMAFLQYRGLSDHFNYSS